MRHGTSFLTNKYIFGSTKHVRVCRHVKLTPDSRGQDPENGSVKVLDVRSWGVLGACFFAHRLYLFLLFYAKFQDMFILMIVFMTSIINDFASIKSRKVYLSFILFLYIFTHYVYAYAA